MLDSISSGLSSAGSALQGGVQSAFSSASSLAEKVGVKDIAGGIKDGFGKASDAIGGIFKKAPSVKADTSFPSSTLPRATARKEETPQFVAPVPGTPLIYPVDMKYFTKFTFYQYKRLIATETPKQLPTATIVLPMPSNLSEAFTVGYDTPALGTLAGVGSEGLMKALEGAKLGNDAVSMVKGALGGATEGGTVKGMASAATLAAAMNFMKNNKGTIGQDLIRKTTGMVPNPFLAVLFRNVDMRTHQFSYRFAPNNLKELQTVKSIIKQLKIRMLPGLLEGSLDAAFTFPDTCLISFGPVENPPYKIKRCVLENMSVNYSPNGPAFFKTGDPVIVDVSLSFKEIEIYTRRDELGPRSTSPI